LAGSNTDYLPRTLTDFSEQGQYYVTASNTVAGGSLTSGPTNTLVEVAPTIVNIKQLHDEMYYWTTNAGASSPVQTLASGSTFYVNGSASTDTVTTVGCVTTFGQTNFSSTNISGCGFGNGYGEYYIQDQTGYGVQVYGGDLGNTNQPPIGSWVQVSGLLEVYHNELELEPQGNLAAEQAGIIQTNLPSLTITPVLANAEFNALVTNPFTVPASYTSCSMVTFTNCYLYGSSSGGPFGASTHNSGGYYSTNSYGIAYFTVGSPYGTPANNTNTMEIYQFTYNYPYLASPPLFTNLFYAFAIPTHLYQVTGAFLDYASGTTPGAEIMPSRPADYVVNAPVWTNKLTVVGKVGTITWPAQLGSTYSVYSASNPLGPWTQAYGLAYYPTNGSFTSPQSPAYFYYVTSP